MTRGRRVATGFAWLALLLGVVWCCRAAYLFRVWQIATLWANAPDVTPPISAFFSADAWGATRHGSFADAVFLRVPMGDHAEPFVSALSPAPTQTPPMGDGCGSDWASNSPALIAPQSLASCYGVAEAFGTPTVAPRSVVRGAGRGGTVWLTDANTLYITGYQTR